MVSKKRRNFLRFLFVLFEIFLRTNIDNLNMRELYTNFIIWIITFVIGAVDVALFKFARKKK